jgi:hypothetical protein
MITLPATASALRPIAIARAHSTSTGSAGVTCSGWGSSPCGTCGTLGGLSGISAENFVLQRSAVKTTNNRRHLVRRGGFYESETLGLLRFMITDYFDRIGDEVVGG